jgi:protein-disulfide isomerase
MSKKTIFFTLLVVILIIASGALVYGKEKSILTLGEKNLEDLSYSDLYKNYISIKPQVDGREFIGNSNASITMIAFLDLSAKPSRDFMTNMFPVIVHEYVETGKIRFYMKYSISKEDINKKSAAYLLIKKLDCIRQLESGSFYLATLDASKEGEISIDRIKEVYGIEEESLNSCINSKDSDELLQDAIDYERQAIVGYSPVLLVGIDGTYTSLLGIPEYKNLKRVIKDYQRQIGD